MIPSIPKMSLLSADGGIWPSLSKNKIQIEIILQLNLH